MTEAKLKYELKRLELMIQKIESQPCLTKASVLSAAVERQGFWYQDAEIDSKIMASALKLHYEKLKKMHRKSQTIQKC